MHVAIKTFFVLSTLIMPSVNFCAEANPEATNKCKFALNISMGRVDLLSKYISCCIENSDLNTEIPSIECSSAERPLAIALIAQKNSDICQENPYPLIDIVKIFLEKGPIDLSFRSTELKNTPLSYIRRSLEEPIRSQLLTLLLKPPKGTQ